MQDGAAVVSGANAATNTNSAPAVTSRAIRVACHGLRATDVPACVTQRSASGCYARQLRRSDVGRELVVEAFGLKTSA